MSDDENFLARWSRRKREGAVADQPAPPDPAKPAEAPPESAADAPEVDLSTLPPLDAIDAATDIRAFFARGVPAALTQAALRKVWTADPAIRDFIGPAENAWDFTAPGGVPGFGPMTPSVEPASALARLVGDSDVAVEPSAVQDGSGQVSGSTPYESMSDVNAESHSFVKDDRDPGASGPNHVKQNGDRIADKQNEDVAPQDVNSAPDLSTTIARRRHGGALPS
jgi:hypothetical protein